MSRGKLTASLLVSCPNCLSRMQMWVKWANHCCTLQCTKVDGKYWVRYTLKASKSRHHNSHLSNGHIPWARCWWAQSALIALLKEVDACDVVACSPWQSLWMCLDDHVEKVDVRCMNVPQLQPVPMQLRPSMPSAGRLPIYETSKGKNGQQASKC